MEFTPIKSKRLLETVVQTLEEPILNGSFKVGAMLPSEEQLANQLGVGRRAVREALKVLETKGLVEVQMGVGTVVRRNDLDSFLKTLTRNVQTYLTNNRAKAEHVMQLRLLLEGAALEHIVAHPDETLLARLREAVTKQRQSIAANDAQSYQEWHFLFHHSIIDSLSNPIISMLYRQVMAMMRGPMERAGSMPARSSQAVIDHEHILTAASSGSTADLHHVLQAHLVDFFQAMQEQEKQVAEPAGAGEPRPA